MENLMYALVCIVAVSAFAMIIMVIIAVLKVASQQDDEYELTERIKFQAREGLIERDELTDRDNLQRRDPHDKGVGDYNRAEPGDDQVTP